MSSKPAPSPEIFRSQEAAFIEHYDWLIRWALQFTRNDRARAEDLVQEVFAQFAFAHTDLSVVQNIRAYLYTTLRNTHISEVRLAGRSHGQSQSIVEYSIADAAIGASDPYSLYQTQDQLRRVCQYACLRRQSSRAGSVLILRFFHGYHLSEVGEVLGGTCQAVRQSLRFARNEARLFLDDPGALKFIDRTQTLNVAFSGKVCAAGELLTDLRLAIFRSCQGDCLTVETIRDLYTNGFIVTADNLTLAHIVSCSRCLDGANRVLGLPLLADRHPADALGPNNNWRGGPGGGPGATGNAARSTRTRDEAISGTFLLKCQRRARELFEHHPSELRVTANGYVLGSQSVNSETSRLRLDITIAEPLSFVEVMSEENARLLVMTVEPPPEGEPMQARRVVLSEGRHVEVTLRHGHPWPMLEVVYQDPNFSSETQLSPSDEDGIWEASQAAPARVLESLPLTHLAGARLRAITSPQSRSLDRLPLEQEERILPAVGSASETRQAGLLNLLRGGKLPRRPVWSRPGFITATVSLLLIGALLFLRLNVMPSVTAANLLERASAAEANPGEGRELAIHRVVNLEERHHPGGDLISRRRIEIWRDAAKDLNARRVYDEKGNLLAAEFARGRSSTEGDASRMIYRPNEAPRNEPPVRDPREAISNLELWQLEPSARDYAEIVARADTSLVTESPGAYMISYAGMRAGAGNVLKAELTLRRSDLHAVDLSLIIRVGAETHEYRFVEASFERPPFHAVAPAAFEPDPNLLAEKLKDDGLRTKHERDPLDPSFSGKRFPVVATPELEVEVAYLLDQFRARLGDQLNLTRAADGALEIRGIVDTDELRREILRALSPVGNNLAVRVRINTVTEALALQPEQPSDRLIVREFAGSDEAIASYPELQRYFSRQGDRPGEPTRAGASSSVDRVDQTVRSFAARMVGRSRRAVSHAVELKQLSRRFSAAELDALSPSARARLFNLVRNHAEALRREISLLSGELQPIFFPDDRGAAESAGIEISSNASLALAIERLSKLVLLNDETIRSTFAASSDASSSQALRAPGFRLSLVTAERLAGGIQEFAAKE